MTQLICGVDVASLSLQASIGRSGPQASFAHTPEGIASLAEFCHAHQIGLVAMEATGGYERRAFRSIKGIADRTVARIMAEMPEIGTLSNKAVSKLAGLAPLANDSGKHQGKRPVQGGRSAVREILFVVASIAGRFEPDFVLFRQRLLDRGKPPKVVRTALAHKLLVRLNAKAREVRRRFQPKPSTALVLA